MEKPKTIFKATYEDLKQTSSGGYLTYVNNEQIMIVTDYLNPIQGEGFATVRFYVNEQEYKRNFDREIPSKRFCNFISKFVNDVDYRKQYLVEKNFIAPTDIIKD